LAAKFVSKETFLNKDSPGNNIYLPYVGESDRPTSKVEMRDNYYSSVLGDISLSRVSIGTAAIKLYCPSLDCFLVLSVYPEGFKDSIEGEEEEYEIEVSQEETYLAIGESKIGMVSKGEYYTYLIDPEDGII
jgi:hypothetical protein